MLLKQKGTWIIGKKKSCLGESNVGDVPLSINYYTGCSFGCLYCFGFQFQFCRGLARKQTPFGRTKANYKDWINPVLEPNYQKLDSQLKNKWRGEVFFQSVSDSYAPHSDVKVTREILELLRKYDYPILVLTKSPKVLRDIDFFKDYRGNCRVGLTITIPEKYESLRKSIEPHSPSTTNRILALKTLYSKDCQTTVSLEPLIPNIPVQDMLELLDRIRPLIYNVCFVGKLTANSIPFQFRNHKAWKGIGKGKYEDYYRDLLTQLLPSIKRRYNLAEHTFEFCMKHKIKGREVSYNRLPKKYQDKII